jgi:hypothetical protein
MTETPQHKANITRIYWLFGGDPCGFLILAMSALPIWLVGQYLHADKILLEFLLIAAF